MSVFLYRLGAALARRPALVVGGWFLVLVGVLGASMAFGDNYDDSFSIPGTESQQGQDILLDRFDQSGTTAQVVLTASSGRIDDGDHAATVKKIAAAIDAVPQVDMPNPLGPPPGQSKPVLSGDGRSTLGTASFAKALPSDKTLDAVQAAARPPAGSDITTSVGGDAYKATNEPSKVPELLGLLVSFMILAVTFTSLLAAGMPIVSSLVGVLVTLSSVVLVSHFVTVSSTSPTLAEMLGLAVGIDYALFILSRYRRQLREPDVTPAVAMSRALATAGSAVVFAGTTVIIALCGLLVARIPVLTVMGLAAAASVAVAVVVALTLLPSVALLLGERLRPRVREARERPERVRKGRLRRRNPSSRPGAKPGFATRWVHLITARPLVTIAGVVGLLLVASLPLASMKLALPDNSTAPEGTPQRQTYDDITKAFGEGWNAPLSVTAGVITSTDPTKTVNQLAKAIAALPGVVAVPQATPNQSADTALVQVIPSAGQTSPKTAALVNELRQRSASLEKKYGVTDILVTGPTAINIDVSDRLAGSLLPFAAIVIGLSLLLLMIVFRSLAVPVKATLGYLLSVGAALGAVVLVFQEGVLDAMLPGLADGPIVSFLPIFVMGVLFGLAMDYEMFLVSAMREEYVTHHDPRDAVLQGFKASSVVVTAAALIMTSVFIAFIPGGSSTIKPIAFGLAVGVFVDAFLVRMTLVPAVLVLLGHRAWWLPGPLERKLPVVDVEGAAMHRKVQYEDWERTHGTSALVGRHVVVAPGEQPVEVEAPPGRVTVVDVPPGTEAAALAEVLVGRRRPASGDLVVDGMLLPEQAAAVHRHTASVEVGRVPDDTRPEPEQVRDRARLTSSSRGHRDAFVAQAEELLGVLDAAATSVGGHPGPVGRAVTRDAVLQAALAVAGGVSLLVITEEGPESNVPAGTAAALARALGARGVTVVLLRRAEGGPAPEAPRRVELVEARA
jgi:RND superfamily putative drug exporter